MPSKKHRRFKLLLDEGLPPKEAFPQVNNLHDVKHIKHDLKKGGTNDANVYLLAKKQERIVVVLNTKDFKPLIKSGWPSVIALSTRITNRQGDLKICKALHNLKPSEVKECLISISNSGISVTHGV